MDDEEEIDIIGLENYDDITNISSGQLLSCDYTVHPNWVNESPEGNNFWSNSVPKNENLESNVEVLQSDEIIIEEPEPVPSLIDSDWVREHATSPNDVIFEEDIPASIEEIVANEEEIIDEEECEEECDDYEDSEIPSQSSEYQEFEPAAFETHPPDVNVKYIGPTNERSILKVKIGDQSCNDLKQSNLLNNWLKIVHEDEKNATNRNITQIPQTKFKKTLKINSNLLKDKQKIKLNFKQKKSGKFKSYNDIRSRILNSNKTSLVKMNNTRTKSSSSLKMKKSNKQKYTKENITISHEAETKILEAEILAGNIVKVDKSNVDSDIEIDVEDITTNDNDMFLKNYETPINSIIDPQKEAQVIENNNNNQNNGNSESNSKQNRKLDEGISDELARQLKDMNKPKYELKINPEEISELEKYINYEFFDGRGTKTPEQYSRIRNHILSMWNSMKPNYVTKTSVRNGLKHGGDVNNISRIHRLLEQIGAINFGHEGEYFEYLRPLENFVKTYVKHTTNRNSDLNSNNNLKRENKNSLPIERRQRVRSRRISSITGSETVDDANYTIIHMDGVVRPDPPRLNSENKIPTSVYRHIKSEYDLVKCLRFSKENIAPFTVSLTLSTLLCMQLHSFSSNHEVMGILGGYCSKSVGRNKINLTRYKPCRTSEQSGTMCEMCPVSQVEQSFSLGAEGLALLGWFHSHPLFPANPSRTDIHTQKEMQHQFSLQNDRPFLGLILSCLNLSLKCIYIMPRDLKQDLRNNEIPYELEVDIIKDCTNLKNYIKDVLVLLETNCDISITEVKRKFKESSEELLSRFGYNAETFFDNIL